MKTRRDSVAILFVAGCLFLSAFLQSSPTFADTLYNPAVTYPGSYVSNKLYFSNNIKNLDRQWEPGDLTGPDAVTCPQAHRKLRQQGVWRGRLARNGSCGENGPVRIWAVGNLINYELSIPVAK